MEGVSRSEGVGPAKHNEEVATVKPVTEQKQQSVTKVMSKALNREVDSGPVSMIALLTQEKKRIIKKQEAPEGKKIGLEEILNGAVDNLKDKQVGSVAHYAIGNRHFFAFVAPGKKSADLHMKVYEVKSVVGKGTFGEVAKVEKVYQKKIYARKLFTAQTPPADIAATAKGLMNLWEGGLPALDNHIPIMHPPERTVLSDHLADASGVDSNKIKPGGKSFFLTPLYEENLKDMIQDPDFTEKHGLTLMRQMIFALEIFESKGLLHPDFKPGNVMHSKDGFLVIDCDDLMKLPKLLPRAARQRMIRHQKAGKGGRMNYLPDNFEDLKYSYQLKGTAEFQDRRNLNKIDNAQNLPMLADAAVERGRIAWGIGLMEAMTGSRPASNQPRGELFPEIDFPLTGKEFERLPPAVQNVLTLLVKGDLGLSLDHARKLIEKEDFKPSTKEDVLIKRLANVDEISRGNAEVAFKLICEILVLAYAAGDKPAMEMALGLAAGFYGEADKHYADLLNSQSVLLNATEIPKDFGKILQRHFKSNALGEEAAGLYLHVFRDSTQFTGKSLATLNQLLNKEKPVSDAAKELASELNIRNVNDRMHESPMHIARGNTRFFGETAILALLLNDKNNFIHTLENAISSLPKDSGKSREIAKLLAGYKQGLTDVVDVIQEITKIFEIKPRPLSRKRQPRTNLRTSSEQIKLGPSSNQR